MKKGKIKKIKNTKNRDRLRERSATKAIDGDLVSKICHVRTPEVIKKEEAHVLFPLRKGV